MVTTVKKLSQGFGYKYSDLSTIHEELEKQNITYYQYIEYNAEAEADYVYTVLTIDGKELPARRGCRVVSGGDSMKSLAQVQGSALTYARRYSLLMALGWATEDDDGATAGGASSADKQTKKATRKVDFAEVRKELKTIDTIDELNKYWYSLNLTEVQAKILKDDFAKRKEEINDNE